MSVLKNTLVTLIAISPVIASASALAIKPAWRESNADVATSVNARVVIRQDPEDEVLYRLFSVAGRPETATATNPRH